MENGEKEFSIKLIDQPAKFFGYAISIEDKTTNEKVQLISQPGQKDKQAVFLIIDGMLTKSKF